MTSSFRGVSVTLAIFIEFLWVDHTTLDSRAARLNEVKTDTAVKQGCEPINRLLMDTV